MFLLFLETLGSTDDEHVASAPPIRTTESDGSDRNIDIDVVSDDGDDAANDGGGGGDDAAMNY